MLTKVIINVKEINLPICEEEEVRTHAKMTRTKVTTTPITDCASTSGSRLDVWNLPRMLLHVATNIEKKMYRLN